MSHPKLPYRRATNVRLSVYHCSVIGFPPLPVLFSVAQLVTTLLIAGLDKSLHIMSKEFRSSNRQSPLDLDFKSIHVGGLVAEGKAGSRVVFKLCSRTLCPRRLFISNEEIGTRLRGARVKKLYLAYAFFSKPFRLI